MKIRGRSLFASASLVAFSAAIGSLPAQAASADKGAAQTSGRWEGVARVPGQGALRVVIALDSSSSGWRGTLTVPSQSPQPFKFASVARAKDSLILQLPANAQNG